MSYESYAERFHVYDCRFYCSKEACLLVPPALRTTMNWILLSIHSRSSSWNRFRSLFLKAETDWECVGYCMSAENDWERVGYCMSAETDWECVGYCMSERLYEIGQKVRI